MKSDQAPSRDREQPRWRAACACIAAALLAMAGLPLVQAWHACEPGRCDTHPAAAAGFVQDHAGAAHDEADARHSHTDPVPGSPIAPHDSSHCGLCAVLATLISGGCTVPEIGTELPLATAWIPAVAADQAWPTFELDAACAPRGPPRA